MTKIIQELKNLPFRERLQKLELHFLERGMQVRDIIEVLKWVKGLNKGKLH